ncbi:MAG: DUF971 domain-containing protein [Acidimicrobiales bacterium]
MERDQVRDVTIERSEGVEVVFLDGHRCHFGLEELRRACPCASCRGARDQGRDPAPTSATVTIRDAQFVGAWGLSIAWSDGHGTGIYPWESLRRWSEFGRPSYRPDSGLGGVGASPPEDS